MTTLILRNLKGHANSLGEQLTSKKLEQTMREKGSRLAAGAMLLALSLPAEGRQWSVIRGWSPAQLRREENHA